jgi:hypothetical protein
MPHAPRVEGGAGRRLSTIDASGTFGFVGGRLRGIAMLITADDTYELEDKSRGSVQLALDTYHRPPAALGAREQDFLSPSKQPPFCGENGSRAGVFLTWVIAQLPVAAQKNRTSSH